MEELILETRHTNGTCERTVTTGVRALVGSGAHCDLRLSPDQAAFEHVAIEMGPRVPLRAPWTGRRSPSPR